MKEHTYKVEVTERANGQIHKTTIHAKSERQAWDKATLFRNKIDYELGSIQASTVHVEISNNMTAFDQFTANKKVLSSQAQIRSYFEDVLNIDYDREHPYFRLHVYTTNNSYIVEKEDGKFHCEIENTCEEGTLAEMEAILYEWSKDDLA